MDMIKRNLLGKTALENQEARNMLNLVALPYRKHFRPLRVKEFLVSLGTKTEFRVAPNAGKVTVTYVIDQRTIRVKADFNCVRKQGLKKILLLSARAHAFALLLASDYLVSEYVNSLSHYSVWIWQVFVTPLC